MRTLGSTRLVCFVLVVMSSALAPRAVQAAGLPSCFSGFGRDLIQAIQDGRDCEVRSAAGTIPGLTGRSTAVLVSSTLALRAGGGLTRTTSSRRVTIDWSAGGAGVGPQLPYLPTLGISDSVRLMTYVWQGPDGSQLGEPHASWSVRHISRARVLRRRRALLIRGRIAVVCPRRPARCAQSQRLVGHDKLVADAGGHLSWPMVSDSVRVVGFPLRRVTDFQLELPTTKIPSGLSHWAVEAPLDVRGLGNVPAMPGSTDLQITIIRRGESIRASLVRPWSRNASRTIRESLPGGGRLSEAKQFVLERQETVRTGYGDQTWNTREVLTPRRTRAGVRLSWYRNPLRRGESERETLHVVLADGGDIALPGASRTGAL